MRELSKKLYLLLAALLCMSTALYAQEVRGVVTDSNGEPLPGVSVVVEGTTLGTQTDLDGAYVIEVPDINASNLQFIFIGMKDQIIPVNGRTVIDVVMEEDVTMLEETVVIGYATVKRRDLLGSVSSISNEKITEQPVTSVSQALTGRMAGVSVTTTEGDPDADIKIRVRGGGSITQDSSPLYIVDGFPVDNINDIAASEIQSMDVLKDAFSTAIYGSRGANGVVIITTKSGEKGRKVSVSVNAYYGQKWMANRDAIQTMDSENFVRFQYELGLIRDNISDNYEPFFGSFDDIDLYYGLPTNDWVGMVFGNTGQTWNTDVTLSGGGENYNWTLGYAHMDDHAIMTGSSYARDNLNLKAQYKPHKSLTFDVNVRYSNMNTRGSGANSMNDAGSTSGNGRLKHAVSYTPIPISSSIQNVDLEEDYGDNAPPLLSVADNDSKRTRTQWNANGAVTWEIIPNLRLKVEGGLQDYRQMDNRFYGLTTYYVANTATYKNLPASRYTDRSYQRYRNTNTLSYDFSEVFDDDRHNLNFILGEEMIITKSHQITAMVENFPESFDSDMAWNFMSTGTPISYEDYFDPDDRLLSGFFRANYEFDERYSIGATIRADGSSKFGPGNRWGFFPSAAASWRISAEPWMQGAKGWLDELKIRYSYGTAGNNNIPANQINRVYNGSSTSWISMGNTYYTTGTVMSNPDLKWETTMTHNIGLDFSFFQGRFSGSVEVYQNDTKDLLIEFPIAGSGYETQYRNIGSTRNRGIEATINLPIVRKQNFDLSFNANIAFNQNRVTDLGGLDRIEYATQWASTEVGTDYVVEVGLPIGSMYGYQNDGMYTVDDFEGYIDGEWVLKEGVADASAIIGSDYLRPGALKLKDRDGDGAITTADKTVIGDANPLFAGGFSLSGYVYGVDFSANFSYSYGNDIYNANKIEFTSSRKYYNRNLIKQMNVENRWTNVNWETGELVNDPETLAAMNQGVTMWSPAIGNAVFSDWAVEDGSYLRLQSATIGYTFPEKWTSRAYIRKLRIYATGTNLFCWTNYSGYDPEVDTRRDTPLSPGVDYSAYPKSIGFVFGINLTF